MSDEMKAILDQAKSQARFDLMKHFYQKNKKLLTRLALVVIAALVAFAAFKIYQNAQERKFSEILHRSFIEQQLGQIDKAKENLQKIYETKYAPSGIWSLASLRYAALMLEEGKKSQAAEVYVKINKCLSCDDYFRDAAGLLAVKTWMSEESEIKKEDLASRIKKIEDSSKTLRYHIAEQRALLEMQKNNLEKSYEIFGLIANSPESPQELKVRASDGLRMVISKGYEPRKTMAKPEITAE